MRYLNETEILPILNYGKVIEQFLGEFYMDNFKCYRYVSLEKTNDGYVAFLSEIFDDSDEGIESIYDYSSIEPDELDGKEIGPFENLQTLLLELNKVVNLNSSKYLMAGYMDEEKNN